MTDALFERNLELLLKRAYVPALPRESFREALERDFLARAVRYAGREVAPASATSARRRPVLYLVGVFAAAAAVLAMALGLWWTDAGRKESLEALLARGQAASRSEPDGAWRAALDFPDFDGAFLELVTPADARAKVAGRGGSFELEQASRLLLRSQGSAVRAELRAGGLSIEREEGAGELHVSTSEGEFTVQHGEVRVAYEPPPDPRADWGSWVRVLVRTGAASVAAPDGPHALGAGSEVFLRGGELLGRGVPEPAPATPGVASERTGVDPPAAPEPGAAVVAPQIFGTVLAGADGGPPLPVTRFQVVLLAEVSLPQVAEPIAFAFESEDGSFELSGLAPRRYALFVRAEGYALWRGERLQIEAPDGPGSEFPGEVRALLELGASARGIVIDAGTGLPIADALVVSETDAPVQILSVALEDVSHELLTTVRTGADGGFELSGLTPGQQVLRAWAPGYGPAWTEPFELNAERGLERDLELDLERGAILHGTATDAAGRPIADAFVVCSLTDFSASHPVMTYGGAFTDADGAYEIRDLPEGLWPLLYFESVIDAAAQDPGLEFVQLFAGERRRHDFRGVGEGLRLAGKVVDADGAPVPERSLWLLPADATGPEAMRSTTSAADGSYAFGGLQPDTYLVFVTGLTPQDMVVLGSADLTGGVDLTEHVLELAGGVVLGRVVDGVTGEPLAFATVVLLQTDDPADPRGFRGRILSGEGGRFEFAGVGAGSYQVLVFASEGGSYGQEVLRELRVAEGAELALGDVHLYPGGGLELVVHGPDGRPVAGAAIRTRFEDGLVYRLNDYPVTQSDGRYGVSGMSAGRWTVVVEAEGLRRATREVQIVVSEQPLRLEVRLERE